VETQLDEIPFSSNHVHDMMIARSAYESQKKKEESVTEHGPN
jgi:hypothetical protein